MSLERWSDNIVLVELQEDPAFSDDMATAMEHVETHREVDVVLDFSHIRYINSSNVAKLLKLRKVVIGARRRLVLCGIDTNVWGLFLVTGLDKLFEFADDVSTGLASLQLPAQ